MRATAEAVTGSFNYLAADTASSLYRNGRVFTLRNRDGSDAGTQGVVVEPHEMAVIDARSLGEAERPALDSAGCELLADPAPAVEFMDHEAVVERYYPHCEALLAVATGAEHVFAFDHNVRSAAGKQEGARIRGGQEVQGPAHVVHGDYTLTSAPQRLRDLASPPTGNDTFRTRLEPGETLVPAELAGAALAGERRFSIVNVWRNILAEPVGADPLALCDARSVDPDELVVFEIRYAERIGENYFAKYSPAHRWYWYPDLERDEALLIKQWDSAGGLARSEGHRGDAETSPPCTFSFHSAFRRPGIDAPPRWSIEVRCLLVYPA